MRADVILTIGQYAGAISASALTLGLFIKWVIVKPIKLYIDQMTYPIQPHANGGSSLPDLILAVRDLERKVSEVDTRLETVEAFVTSPKKTASKKA